MDWMRISWVATKMGRVVLEGLGNGEEEVCIRVEC